MQPEGQRWRHVRQGVVVVLKTGESMRRELNIFRYVVVKAQTAHVLLFPYQLSMFVVVLRQVPHAQQLQLQWRKSREQLQWREDERLQRIEVVTGDAQ